MNNKQLIKQITKDLKLCAEWSEKNKIIMEDINTEYVDEFNIEGKKLDDEVSKLLDILMLKES